nr:hypothetical protein TCMXXGQR_TCMXXGQR_CDS_0008 [Microvirus sp.]
MAVIIIPSNVRINHRITRTTLYTLTIELSTKLHTLTSLRDIKICTSSNKNRSIQRQQLTSISIKLANPIKIEIFGRISHQIIRKMGNSITKITSGSRIRLIKRRGHITNLSITNSINIQNHFFSLLLFCL